MGTYQPLTVSARLVWEILIVACVGKYHCSEKETISSISAYSTITTDHATKVTEDNTAISNAATAQTTLEATYGWKREQEYPNIKDQLDDIYHNGVEGWKTTIKTTKDKYPK